MASRRSMVGKDDCLNCKAPECKGIYPNCAGMPKKKNYKRTKLRELGKGNATILISLLVKLGLKRLDIAEICDTTQQSVNELIKRAVMNGMLTAEEADASRVKVRTSTYTFLQEGDSV